MQAFIYKKSLQLWTEHVLDEYKGPGPHLNNSSQLTQPLFRWYNMHTLFTRIKRFKFWKIKIILLRITALRLRSCIVYRTKIAKWLCSLKLIKNLGKIIVNLKAKCLRNNWGSDKKHRSYERKKSMFKEFQGYIFFKNARMGGVIIFVPWAKFGVEYWYSGYFSQ